MKVLTLFVAALSCLLVSCSGPQRVVLRIDRSACMRVERIPKDVELVIVDCTMPRDTILVIKEVK